MDRTGRRLALAMLTVVVLLGLNAAAVISGSANGTYARLFGHEPERQPGSTAANGATAAALSNSGGCMSSPPKPTLSPALLPVMVGTAERDPVARMC